MRTLAAKNYEHRTSKILCRAIVTEFMLNTARHMNEIVVAVPCHVLGFNELIIAWATKKPNVFNIAVTAAHTSRVHGCNHACAKVAVFLGLTLPACLFCFIRNDTAMIIASRIVIRGVMFAIVKPNFLFVAGHFCTWGLRSKGKAKGPMVVEVTSLMIGSRFRQGERVYG